MALDYSPALTTFSPRLLPLFTFKQVFFFFFSSEPHTTGGTGARRQRCLHKALSASKDQRMDAAARPITIQGKGDLGRNQSFLQMEPS